MNLDSTRPEVASMFELDSARELARGRVAPFRRWLWFMGITLFALGGLGTIGWRWYRASVLQSIPKQIATAEVSLRSGKCDVARSQVSAILYFNPAQPDALGILGRCLLEEKQFDAAIAALAQIPEDSTAFEKSGFAWASACLLSGELEQAEWVLKRYLKRFPAAENAREELRWLCFNQFRTRDVEAILKEKLRLRPGDHQTLADLLDCEYRQQVPYEGAGYLEQINQRKPGQGTVTLALGYARWRMGQTDAARKLFGTALAARSDDPHVRFTVAAFLIEQGQIKDAEQLMSTNPQPEDDRYWSILSQIAELRNDAAPALQSLERAIERRGNDYRYASRRTSLLRKLSRSHDIEAASLTAHKLQQIDREFANIVEANTHHETTRREAIRIAELYTQAGQRLQAENWRILASQLPEGHHTP